MKFISSTLFFLALSSQNLFAFIVSTDRIQEFYGIKTYEAMDSELVGIISRFPELATKVSVMTALGQLDGIQTVEFKILKYSVSLSKNAGLSST